MGLIGHFTSNPKKINHYYIKEGFLLSLLSSSSMTSFFSPLITGLFIQQVCPWLAHCFTFTFFFSPATFHLQPLDLSTLCSCWEFLHHHNRPSCLTDTMSDPQHHSTIVCQLFSLIVITFSFHPSLVTTFQQWAVFFQAQRKRCWVVPSYWYTVAWAGVTID